MKTKTQKILGSVTMIGLLAACSGKNEDSTNDNKIPNATQTTDLKQSKSEFSFNSSDIDEDSPHYSTNELYFEVTTEKCSTGRHTVHNAKEFCIALRDEELNKNCGKDKRQEIYQEVGCQRHDDLKVSKSHLNPNAQDYFEFVHCSGYLQKGDAKAPIEKTVRWDGQSTAKRILTNFGSLGDGSGETSIHFEKHPKSGKKTMQIFGWFIDSHKNDAVVVPVDSGFELFHSDPRFQTEISIKCRNQAFKPQADFQNKTIACFGFADNSKAQSREIVSTTLDWDGKAEMAEDFKREVLKEKGDPDLVSLKLNVKAAEEGKGIDLTAASQHASGVSRSFRVLSNSIFFSSRYLNAWSGADLSFSCFEKGELESNVKNIL